MSEHECIGGDFVMTRPGFGAPWSIGTYERVYAMAFDRSSAAVVLMALAEAHRLGKLEDSDG